MDAKNAPQGVTIRREFTACGTSRVQRDRRGRWDSLAGDGTRPTHHPVSSDKVLRPAPVDIPTALRTVVEYRKSGLSLNHVVGCPLDCGYCIRHVYHNYDMKRPHLVMEDRAAVAELTGHWAFQAHLTPIQILQPRYRPVPARGQGASAIQPVGTGCTGTDEPCARHHPLAWSWPEDVAQLERLENIRLTILVTWSGIEDERIEPVRSAEAERSLQTLSQSARRTRCILYWRPLIAGLNDTPEHLKRARALSALADATVFTGLFHRHEIPRAFPQRRCAGPLPRGSPAARSFPPTSNGGCSRRSKASRIFRKTSCAVAFAHGMADYNGHFGIRDICDICPSAQQEICRAGHAVPSPREGLRSWRPRWGWIRHQWPSIIGASRSSAVRNNSATTCKHALNYQVHDRDQPHLERRHGRADLGWT